MVPHPDGGLTRPTQQKAYMVSWMAAFSNCSAGPVDLEYWKPYRCKFPLMPLIIASLLTHLEMLAQ